MATSLTNNQLVLNDKSLTADWTVSGDIVSIKNFEARRYSSAITLSTSTIIGLLSITNNTGKCTFPVGTWTVVDLHGGQSVRTGGGTNLASHTSDCWLIAVALRTP